SFRQALLRAFDAPLDRRAVAALASAQAPLDVASLGASTAATQRVDEVTRVARKTTAGYGALGAAVVLLTCLAIIGGVWRREPAHPDDALTAHVQPAPAGLPLPTPAPRASSTPGYVSINAQPWAKIAIDGKHVGYTPILRLSLSPGHHQIRAVAPGAAKAK